MKSLESGASKIVPVRMPESVKDALQAALRDGETLSSLLRDSAIKEAKKRQRAAQKAAERDTCACVR
jgi:hypothetical protein